jgi:translin
MLAKNHFVKIRKEYASYEEARREVVKRSGDALAFSKQAIFALHRNDFAAAQKLLLEARQIQQKLKKKLTRVPGLVWEGSYRAMLEEFAEASLYFDFLKNRQLGPVAAEGIDADAYLGGLMDATGEIVRHAVLAATQGDTREASRSYRVVEAILGELTLLNITGPLRPKYDQAKNNLRKLEEIMYDLSIRKR